MKKFRTKIWEQVTIWQDQEITFEALDLTDAKNKLLGGISILDNVDEYGDCEISYETMTSTGNYDFKNSIEILEEV